MFQHCRKVVEEERPRPQEHLRFPPGRSAHVKFSPSLRQALPLTSTGDRCCARSVLPTFFFSEKRPVTNLATFPGVTGDL